MASITAKQVHQYLNGNHNKIKFNGNLLVMVPSHDDPPTQIPRWNSRSAWSMYSDAPLHQEKRFSPCATENINQKENGMTGKNEHDSKCEHKLGTFGGRYSSRTIWSPSEMEHQPSRGKFFRHPIDLESISSNDQRIQEQKLWWASWFQLRLPSGIHTFQEKQCVTKHQYSRLLDYFCPADIMGHDCSVQNSVMLPYNKLIWLKKSTAKMRN